VRKVSERVRVNKLKRDRTFGISLKGNVESSGRGRFEQELQAQTSENKC
jgi:hypothetical protein